jgi:hypothetical protein
MGCEILYFRNTFQYTFQPAKILKLLVCTVQQFIVADKKFSPNETQPFSHSKEGLFLNSCKTPHYPRNQASELCQIHLKA